MQKPKNLSEILEGLSEAVGFIDCQILNAPLNDEPYRVQLSNLRNNLIDARNKVRSVAEA